jgi:hypothetical protein
MYWLVTTAPPVASAVMIWIIRVLKLSTRLTPETAASPTDETIRVSARPMVTLRACSAMSGSSSATSCCRVNIGGFLNLDAVINSSVSRAIEFVYNASMIQHRRQNYKRTAPDIFPGPVHHTNSLLGVRFLP